MILVTLGVALLFIIRKKRKEKRLKRLRGERKRLEGIGMKDKAERFPTVVFIKKMYLFVENVSLFMLSVLSRCQKPGRDADQVRILFPVRNIIFPQKSTF